MRRHWQVLIKLGVAVAALASASAGWASDAPVILDLEGNPSCNSLTVNSITTLKRTSVSAGDFSLVQGSQTVTGTVSTDKHVLESWTATKPVNFVILKGQGNSGAKVFHFGTTGVLSDADEAGPGTSTQISQLTFCYGLSGTTVTPTPVAECTEAEFGVTCETGVKEVFFILHPNDPFFGVQKCTCNEDLEQCDPSLPAGQTGACPIPGKPLTEVPTLIEAVKNPDTLYCTTVGGRRTCVKGP